MMTSFAFGTTPFDSFGLVKTGPILFAAALVAYLTTNLGVPIYPGHIPQNATTPALVYKLARRENVYTLGGTTKSVIVEYVLTAVGEDKETVDTLAENLRGVLASYRGPFGGLTFTGCRKLDRIPSPVQYFLKLGMMTCDRFDVCFVMSSIPHPFSTGALPL